MEASNGRSDEIRLGDWTGGSDWGLPCSKENKAFFLQKLYQFFF